jgi:hypothetical protein
MKSTTLHLQPHIAVSAYYNIPLFIEVLPVVDRVPVLVH